MKEKDAYNGRNISLRIKAVTGGNTPCKDGQHKGDGDTQAFNA